ncbi:DUF4430 domain-containing protein [Nostoc sp. CENA67]|uniref:DUF4430 domain-containing protein n=1 Tax=Amazonocrinis nigriterrae CENA67 TaxID=2794033 RepID=A0A8J7HS71_9NOST|nr:DUF4430 domain-containing protein [Amazonocrinis nigriterrae]MBH8563100.1 DUF4430 domain-containing protein [Amazonocrinis nigriterrae CENA67]
MKILKALAVTVLVLLLVISPALADSSASQGDVTILVFDDGKVIFNIEEVPWVEGETVRTAMLKAAEKEPSFKFETDNIDAYGEIVTKIGDIKAETEEFWVLSINDEPNDIGIDTVVVNNGDVILWDIERQISPSKELDPSGSGETVL